jgi:membrane-associated phospholipid phosphatase
VTDLPETRQSPFDFDPWVDGPAVAAGLALWVTPSIAANVQVRHACDPCDPSELNALDRPVIHFDSTTADRAGDVLVVLVPAAAALATLGNWRQWGWRGGFEDSLLISESMIAAGALQQLFRFAVRRPRPFMYREDARFDLRGEAQASLSFYSGHSATAFAAATAFAYTFSVRRPNSGLRMLVWTLSLMAASTVPFTRVAAGEHFWTDALVGSCTGIGMGLLVPALHRRQIGSIEHPRLQLAPGWAAVSGQF